MSCPNLSGSAYTIGRDLDYQDIFFYFTIMFNDCYMLKCWHLLNKGFEISNKKECQEQEYFIFLFMSLCLHLHFNFVHTISTNVFLSKVISFFPSPSDILYRKCFIMKTLH